MKKLLFILGLVLLFGCEKINTPKTLNQTQFIYNGYDRYIEQNAINEVVTGIYDSGTLYLLDNVCYSDVNHTTYAKEGYYAIGSKELGLISVFNVAKEGEIL